MKTKRPVIIFSPGPANISKRVRNSLLQPDICHRGKEFSAILTSVRQKLLNVACAHDGYEAVVFTGSGTSAIEATLAAFARTGKSLLIISNGIYGERAYEISRIHGIKTTIKKFADNTVPDLKTIDTLMSANKPDALYLVHHETTTGLLNPLAAIADLAKKHKVFMFIDAVSSIAGEEVLTQKWGIDVLIGSSNKCIRGVAGLSFVIISKRFISLLQEKSLRKENLYYLDLLDHLQRERNEQTSFTPAVHAFYAFDEALKELLEETLKKRILHYELIAQVLRAGLRKLGFSIYLDDCFASHTMTTVWIPSGWTYEKLEAECQKYGFQIYACMGALKNKAFRLGIVGCMNVDDIKRFLQSLKIIMRK